MGALKFLLAIQKNVSHQKDALEKGLMFVDAIINSTPAKGTIVDSGASHNFNLEHEAQRLELKIKKDTSKMKLLGPKHFQLLGIKKGISNIRQIERKCQFCRGSYG